MVLNDGTAPKRGSAGRVTPDEVPTAEEVTRLLDAASPGRNRTFFLAAIHTGAREGELLALTRDDVDSEARTLAIRRTVT